MTQILLAIVLPGVGAFAMMCLFFALVPRLAGNGKSIVHVLVQWLLILAVVMPAIAVGMFGPVWIHEVIANGGTTKDERFWFILGGVAVAVLSFVAAVGSPAGRRYSSWRSRIE